MRITGGEIGGRLLKAPRAGLRPTQDRVRASLFSILGARVPGCRFLDLFAGTGAVGIEAWSRGAADVCWVESSAGVVRCLEDNVRTLCGGAGRIVRAEVLRVLKPGFAPTPYDLIYADPPYAKDPRDPEAQAGWQRLLAQVESGSVLVPGGWLAMEQRDGEPVVEREGWILARDRRYGGSRLRILERVEATVAT